MELPQEKDPADEIMVDPDFVAIDAYCDAHFLKIRKNVRQEVETELFLRCQQPVYDKKGFCDAQAVLPFLTGMRLAIEEMLSGDAKRFSKARWLWMLRRVPDRIFEGRLSTTHPYQAVLAETVSGCFGTTAADDHPFEDAEGSIRFKLDGSALPKLVRFVELIRWLNLSHVRLRYSGKGVRFRSEIGSVLPIPIPTEKEESAIRIYDERLAKSATLFGGIGTEVSSKITSVDGFLVAFFSNPDWVRVPVYVQGEAMELKVLKRFLPEMISLSGLAKLNEDARLNGLTWWKHSAAAVLALARGLYRILATSANGIASLLRYGYLFIDEEHFLEVFNDAWTSICSDILRIIPTATPPKSAKELFETLTAFQPSLWPLFPGPVIRRAGNSVWIDIVACTVVLERSLEFPIVDGDMANARADHFEGTTQQTINATPWAPGPILAPLVAEDIKKVDGTSLTDIDAIGEKGSRLLLVSCKSTIQSIHYESGNYVAVRNIRTTAENATRYWAEIAAYLKKNPKGRNYDFSDYKDIIPVVCTPQVIYVADEFSLRFVATGLNAVCSLTELRTWLMNN